MEQRPDVAGAVASARACGRRVEVSGLRSETAQTFVNPNGTTTVEESVEPRRVRRADGSWAALDTSLHRKPDGTLVPAAAVQPMTFSGGGAAPLATMSAGMGVGARELAVSWPAALPVPRVEKDSAIYPEVLPGVDLRVTAAAHGFSHVLIVKTRAAAASPALRQLKFGITAKGLSVAVTAAGGLEARDPTGEIVFTAPTPLMWDSGDPAEEGGWRQALMTARIDRGTLMLTPDPALLDDPGIRLPLYLDPSWSGGISGNAWTSVWSKFPGSSFWQNGTALNNAATYGGAGHGRTEDCDGCADHIIRTIFRMNVAGVRGKQIKRAVFRIQQRHAWTCNPASNAKLWLTDPISPSNTWNSQPGWNSDWTFQTPGNHKVGAAHSCADVGDIEFNVTSLVAAAAASGWTDLNLGLRAVDEGTLLQWKRFNAASPVLAIDYNTVPNVPDTLTIDGKPCVAGSGRPFVSTATPVLRARVSDADGEAQQLQFTYARWSPTQLRFTDIGSGVRENVPNGAFGQITTAALADGEMYTFRAQSNDYNGGVSPMTHVPGNCEWRVDLSDPAPPTVTSDLYAENSAGCPAGGCGGVGQAGTFTFASSPDVTTFRWGFTDPPSTVVAAPSLGAAVTVTWTPSTGGAKTLFVQAIDQSGRTSRRTYQFTVAGPSPAAGWWRLDEATGTTILADSSGNGNAAALTNGVLGVPGRVPGGDTALSLNGVAAQSFASTAGPVLDTGRAFSVAAWVKLTDRNGPLAVVRQRGANIPAFQLEYKADIDLWALSLSGADTDPAPWAVVRSTSRPALNAWTHLTGVYDPAARQARLYVNGRLEGSLGGVVTWRANGSLFLGRDATGQAASALSDVRVWNRMLLDGEIATMAEPTVVGEWQMEEVGPGPAFDSSGMGKDLTFRAGASIPPGGSGHTGTGLRVGNPSGHATTDGPVVYTDQSFTVSAWVRLADGDPSTPAPDVPIGNRTVVGQSGQWISAFFLGLRYDTAGVPRWGFGMKHIDSNDGPWDSALSTAAVSTSDIGRWVRLVAVADVAAGSIKLYVDGALVASQARTLWWHAGGQLTIGMGWWSPIGGTPSLVDQWIGDIDEVRVHAGAVQNP